MRNYLIACVLCWSVALAPASVIFRGPPVVAPAPIFSSDLTFNNQTEADAYFTTGGSVTWGSSASPVPLISGFDKAVVTAASSQFFRRNLAAPQDELWVCIVFNQASLTNAGFRIRFFDAADNQIGIATALSGGAGTVRLNATSGGSGSNTDMVGEIAATTTYHAQVRFRNITAQGANSQVDWYKTTDGSQGALIGSRTGNASAQVSYISIGAAGSTSIAWSKLRIYTRNPGAGTIP
jgi:hypothetical protein